MFECQPRTATHPPLHRYFVRALGRQRERHQLQMFSRLAGSSFDAPVVEAEPVDFAQAGDERREIFDGEEVLLTFEAPRHQ